MDTWSIAGSGAPLAGRVQTPRLYVRDNAQPVISETSTTSLNGQVTTITTYADGSSSTTVSDGDVVVIRAVRLRA